MLYIIIQKNAAPTNHRQKRLTISYFVFSKTGAKLRIKTDNSKFRPKKILSSHLDRVISPYVGRPIFGCLTQVVLRGISRLDDTNKKKGVSLHPETLNNSLLINGLLQHYKKPSNSLLSVESSINCSLPNSSVYCSLKSCKASLKVALILSSLFCSLSIASSTALVIFATK